MRSGLKIFAVLTFGVLFPCFVAFQAYTSAAALRSDVAYVTTLDDLRGYVDKAHSAPWTANDYALFSLMFVEHGNQRTMINKQRTKTAVVNIGFAVLSIGMMLIILGFEGRKDQNMDAGVAFGELKFNLKTGSAGIGIFVIGAMIATLGGVLKNDYQTSQIPQFEGTRNGDAAGLYAKSIEAYKACSAKTSGVELCFTQVFFQINQEKLK